MGEKRDSMGMLGQNLLYICFYGVFCFPQNRKHIGGEKIVIFGFDLSI